jgi:glycosyltransferase involved in cell wall biosynthesis
VPSYFIRQGLALCRATRQTNIMVEYQPIVTMPLFSVIIPVYNDWIALDLCLGSLAQQTQGPRFEVIVVDDGSSEAVPQGIHRWVSSFPLTIVKQSHSGVSTARNRGIRASKGSILVFVDADCRLQTNCLAALNSTITDSPQHDCFQLRLAGDCSTLVGRAEELRFTSYQTHMVQPSGCIRYLNTAGFAKRRAKADVDAGLFDGCALRGEDTLLLAKLMRCGKLPLFVPSAVVQHCVSLSLLGYLRKSVRSAYLERRAYDIIRSKAVRIRMTHRERLRMLFYMWRTSGNQMIGRQAWLVLTAKQALQRIVSVTCRCLRIRPKAPISTNSP